MIENNEKVYTSFYLFGGSGGAAIGMQASKTEFRGIGAKFLVLGSVDCDADANADFEMFTGVPATLQDLFSREDYKAFHGHEPPLDWREAKPEDLRKATGGIAPDVIFLSPPCKGFSGLLPSKAAQSEKYQALNRLTVRGMKLTLEAFKDDLPSIILFENVPRITTRGEKLLKQIKKMLKKAGYAIHPENDQDGYHDCGQIGGLGQHRRRYLMIARNTKKVQNFVYQPPKLRVRSIGEVLGQLPMPNDPAGGPMHKIPRLEWKTAVRLAMIPSSGDWRDLEKIVPEEYRLVHVPREGVYKIQKWDEPSTTVTSCAAVGKSNGASCVSDPRVEHFKHSYRVTNWDQPAGTVTGGCSPSNGSICVADVRLTERENRHPGVYRVVRFDQTAPCVTGTRFGSGAIAVSDPRTGFKDSTHHSIYQVGRWDEPARTVTGAARPNSGAITVSDPRLASAETRFSNKYQVAKWDKPGPCVTGIKDIQAGAPSVSDPRLGCRCRNGSYGVQDWHKPAKTVTGADIHSGCTAVSDPRKPADNERGTWIIISEDGTWHRPLTTWELLALQGCPLYMPDGSPVVLAGKSDARWRERIGNLVPPPAAMEVGEQALRTLLLNDLGTWELSSTSIWVKPEVNEEENEHIA